MSEYWPIEIRITTNRRALHIAYDDGQTFEISAEKMRVLSPSAEVQGHGPGQKVTVPGKINVEIKNVVPTGNYAIRIVFSDGHDSGIFTWKYLRELGENGDILFREYETELKNKGLSRNS